VGNPERFEPSREGVTIGGTPTTVGKANFHTGWNGVVSLGWGFGNGWRAEIEGSYRENEVDSLRGFGLAPIARTGGFQRTWGVMANGYYDFDFANFGLGQSVIQPYVGVGVGYAMTDYHNFRGVSANRALTLYANDAQSIADGSFAYQAMIGFATPLTWAGIRGLTLTAEYRFFGVVDSEVQGTIRTPANRIVAAPKLEADKYNHAVMIGLRYALFQPPPPPPPVATPQVAPAPAPARTYLVFFDWDRADLTSRAREIIGEAANNARRVQSTRIEVAGHADRSGTPQYNQRLSQRRAEAVANELVSRGIGRNEISVSAYGESRPLVPTADGVREPQNRRVEIVLR
jgi:OOP family OmpA-OmpF porin